MLLPRRRLLLLGLCGLVQCRSGGGTGGAGREISGHFELRLSADNGHVQSPMSLTLDDTGRASLFVGGPQAWPGVEIDNRAGYFATQLSPTELAELRELTRRANVPRLRQPRRPLPSGDYAALTLSADGDDHTHTIAGEQPAAVQALLDWLRVRAEQCLRSPRRAVQIVLERGVEQESPRLELRHLGTDPFEIQLFDPETSSGVRIDLRTAPTELQSVARDEVTAWVEQGRLPSGPTTLKPGAGIELPLSGVELPAAGGFDLLVTLHSVGPGPARGLLRVRYRQPG